MVGLARHSSPRRTASSSRPTLVSVDGRKIPAGKDFDSADRQAQEQRADAARRAGGRRRWPSDIRSGEFRVANVEDKPYTHASRTPPFTTSTLQQEANRKLGFTARRTMQVAQSLYENGHITYMRTDSTNLAQVAIDDARELVASEYGDEYLPAEPRVYQVEGQERPGSARSDSPGRPSVRTARGAARRSSDADEFKLFDMIWKRTIASQMADARGRRITITIEGDGCVFQVSGKTIDFPGYLRAYVEGSDDPGGRTGRSGDGAAERRRSAKRSTARELNAKEHTTQPPARFSEASLTKALEERGIGRPSTYASIIDTILARNYVFKKGSALVPTWVAFSVVQLLEEHLPNLVDYQFTAQMEDDLDAISRGEQEYVDYLDDVLLRQRHAGPQAAAGAQESTRSTPASISRILDRHAGGRRAGVRPRRPLLAVRRARRTHGVAARRNAAGRSDARSGARAARPGRSRAKSRSASAPTRTSRCILKVGRFGPYVQRGTPDDEEKPQNASLLKGMKPADVDLATALKLLTLPRNLGDHPDERQADHGLQRPLRAVRQVRRGNALAAGRRLAARRHARAGGRSCSPSRRRAAAAPRRKKEPLKVFDKPRRSPSKPVQLLDGRYGPYVTDGDTNASLRKGMTRRRADVRRSARAARREGGAGPAEEEGRAQESGAQKGRAEEGRHEESRPPRKRQ